LLQPRFFNRTQHEFSTLLRHSATSTYFIGTVTII
jgi:hypothetical protein